MILENYEIKICENIVITTQWKKLMLSLCFRIKIGDNGATPLKDEAVCVFPFVLMYIGKAWNPFPHREGKIEAFSLGKATGRGDGKYWIQNSYTLK